MKFAFKLLLLLTYSISTHYLEKGDLTLYQLGQNLVTKERKLSENIVGIGENVGNQHFLLFFLHSFLHYQIKIKTLSSAIAFNSFPNKPWFLHVCRISLLKTLGKGKIAHKEQFLLFTVFSIPLENFSHFSSNFEIVVGKPSF